VKAVGAVEEVTGDERERERVRWGAVVQSSRDFIGISDLAGVPLFVNAAGMALIGAEDLEEIRRTPVSDYFVPAQRAFVRDVVLPTVATQRAWRGELTFRHFRTDAPIPVLYDVFRIDDPSTGQPAYFATITKDIREQKRHEDAIRQLADALERQRQLLETVTNTASVALFIIDERRHCVFMNPAAEAMTGLTLDAMRGHAFHDAVQRPARLLEPPPASPIARALDASSVHKGTDTFVRPDGQPYEVAFTASPTPLSGETRGTVIEVRDVTEENRSRRALDETIAERERLVTDLARANASKDEFFAMLGHELRNPLAPIVTALELMRMRSGGAASREQAIIERQVAHLLRMVDDLLDVARIARGKIELRKERVEVADLVSRAVEMASVLLEQRQQQLSIEVAPGLWVDGDPTRLAQALANLLTNAARYTDVGGRIEVTAQGEGAELVVCVTDNGSGIAPELMPRLFDAFVQGSHGPASGGLGLGLALVKGIATLHGGTVSARSEGAGRGSELCIRLPRAPASAAVKPTRDHPATLRAGTPRSVLLVDDNADAAELLAEVLTASGHEVRVALDPVAALAAVHERPPDVAILDIGLPVMDGYELATRMREIIGLRCCPMISLTGYGQEHDRERSRAAGFHAHLVKPVDSQRLLELIAACQPPTAATDR